MERYGIREESLVKLTARLGVGSCDLPRSTQEVSQNRRLTACEAVSYHLRRINSPRCFVASEVLNVFQGAFRGSLISCPNSSPRVRGCLEFI